jgi:hypothetical protein
MRGGEPLGLREVRMLVDVEDPPDLVPAEILVALAPGLLVRAVAELDRRLDDRLRHARLARDLDVDPRVAGGMLKGPEVSGLGLFALAHDENAALRLARRGTPAEGAIVVAALRDHDYGSSAPLTAPARSPRNGMAP